ncbi:hypothetical protein H6F76_17115 [Leptolyngbya sp. FACHB-321]|uniref:hypothetical protein n=1 Tax=Leptolyngbya sp. FACHB-321 TaxID=2692807 RepID=UPI001687C9FF|nr:hypothetical protein [Leptolyngbya sp. FACHB-321]MBD2036733.1 hypothetical protein [Leptolyngbya sp. FACHB-321]
MTILLLRCPVLSSSGINQDGTTRHSHQSHKHSDCNRQLVEHPKPQHISDTQPIIDWRRRQKMALVRIARSLQLRESWLRHPCMTIT